MTGDRHDNLVESQFSAQAAAYVTSAVHADGDDLRELADLARGRSDARVLDLGCGGGHVSFRLAPITRQEAHAQVREIRTFPLLRGVRGEPQADIAAAEEVVLRVSQLVTDFPEIVEMDINPLVVHNQGEGAMVLDARIILQG